VKQPKKQTDPMGVLSFFGFLSLHIPSFYSTIHQKKTRNYSSESFPLENTFGLPFPTELFACLW